MKRLLTLCLALGLLAMTAVPAAGAAGARQRPFSDWLSAQQVAPDATVPIEWQVVSWYEPATAVNIMADMDGQVGAWVAANGGQRYVPQTHGMVTERTLADGRALVQVELTFRDGITYLWQDENDFEDFPAGPALFGYRAEEVAAGATPALGDGHFSMTFVLPAPGLPLPNFNQIAFAPEAGQEIISVAFHASARGPLREASGYAEGTPGKGATEQIGVFQARTPDGYPVEWVVYRPVGH